MVPLAGREGSIPLLHAVGSMVALRPAGVERETGAVPRMCVCVPVQITVKCDSTETHRHTITHTQINV